VRRVFLLLIGCLVWIPPVEGAEAPSLALAALPSEDGVAELLWTRSPEFMAARARLASSQADVVQAALLPNPEVDLSWNTLPVGPTNPPGLHRLKDVPNYQVGLSQRIELGKRGPRQESARAAREATALEVQAQLRERTYEVLERAAEVAAGELRLAELRQLTADAARLTELQRIRQQRGDSAGLDVDRAVLEETQLQGQLAGAQSELAEALLACSQSVGLACEPFGSREAAARFLDGRLSREVAPAPLSQRPDLRSLEAQQQSARAALTLARRGGVPDPTVRLGYVHDRFYISGNQTHSFFVGVSFPLPLFDRGQAEALTASAQSDAAGQIRVQLTGQAEREVQALTAQRAALATRRERLRAHTLPLASGLVQRLEAAVKAGGASLQELLLARRTYGELLLESADLERAAVRVAVALDRVHAAGPNPPAELSKRF
jgi:outer membrane protein, heavy metal efflux system